MSQGFDNFIQLVQILKEIISNTIDNPLENTRANYYENLMNKCLSSIQFFGEECTKDEIEWNTMLFEFHRLNEQRSDTSVDLLELIKEVNKLFEKLRNHSSAYHLRRLFGGNIKQGKEKRATASESEIVRVHNTCKILESHFNLRMSHLFQHSMFYGVPVELPSNEESKSDLATCKMLTACVYACLILHDENIPIDEEAIQSILKSANINIPLIYPTLMAKYLTQDNVLQRIIHLQSVAKIETITEPTKESSTQSYESEEDEMVYYGIFF